MAGVDVDRLRQCKSTGIHVPVGKHALAIGANARYSLRNTGPITVRAGETAKVKGTIVRK